MKESWAKLKEWWASLALREKRAVTLGGSLLGIFIVYQFIWTPYTNYIGEMRDRIQKNEKMLVWMQSADKEIRKIEAQSKNQNKPVALVVLLGLLQKQINTASLEQYLTLLKQASNESIEMHFQKVDFDKLMRLLTAIIKEHSVSISQMSAIALNEPGIVNADIVLKLE
jgi:type II secretory pathway component PulM